MRFNSMFLMACFLAVAVLSFAEEEKKTFPGVPSIEFGQTLQAASTGNTIQCSTYGTAGVYSCTYVRGKLAFNLASFYSFVPWAKESLEIMYDPKLNTPSSGVDTTPYDVTYPNITGRNRVDLGLDNTFTVPDAVTITVSPIFRIESKLNLNAKDATNTDGDDTHGAAVAFLVMPSITFSKAYTMGFDWFLKNDFMMNFYPVMDQTDSDSIFESFKYCGNVELGFNILKAMKVQDYAFRIFVYDKAQPKFFTKNYINDSITYDGKEYTKSGEVTNEYIAGIQAGYQATLFKVGYYGYFKGDFDDCDKTGLNVWNGVYVKAELAKAGWAFGITYVGAQQTWLAYASDDATTRAVVANDQKYWENTVEAYVTVKM